MLGLRVLALALVTSSSRGLPTCRSATARRGARVGMVMRDGDHVSSLALRDVLLGSSLPDSAVVRGLRRVPEDERRRIVDKLEEQWMFTVGDVWECDPAGDEVERIGIPLRLIKALLKLKDDAEEKAPPPPPPSPPPPPPPAQAQPRPGPSPSAPAGERRAFGDVVVTRRGAGRWQGEYSLKPKETNEELQAELDEWYRAMTEVRFRSVDPVVRPVTAKSYLKFVRMALGWIVKERMGAPPGAEAANGAQGKIRHAASGPTGDGGTACSSEGSNVDTGAGSVEERLARVRLSWLVPDSTAAAAETTFDYVQWLKRERGASPNAIANIVRAVIKLSKHRFSSGVTDKKQFDEMGVIRELRSIHNDARLKARTSGPVADESKKWLDWTEFLGAVEALREERSEVSAASGSARSPKAVAQSHQRYLVAAIFSSVPDRQRTLRELEMGKTLVRSECGENFAIRHREDDYKTGGAYGERPLLALPKALSADIEDFWENWRGHLDPKDHNFLFCSRGGKPPNEGTINRILTRSMFRITGKKVNPHLLRDAVVTHIRGTDASEAQLEALALYMGHSLAIQRSTYDKRSKEQKIAPAVRLLEDMKEGGA